MNYPSILIVGNETKPHVGEQVERFVDWLTGRATVCGVFGINDTLDDRVAGAQLCVVFGGDGTLLATARKLAPMGIPLLGVNMGKLGFLAEFNLDQLQRDWDGVVGGEIQPTNRLMLDVTLDDDGESFSSLAANDVSICSGTPFRMIDLCVRQDGDVITQYMGDGLVVATPSGSTGYNLSAGGPILQPTCQAVVISPVAPHMLSLRPIVLDASCDIEIIAARVNPGTNLLIDGQIPVRLHDQATVRIRKADQPMQIVPRPGQTFFNTLSQKLRWGQSPHHRIETSPNAD